MMKKILFALAVAVPALGLIAAAQEKTAPAFKVKVAADQANIRENPDIGSAVLQQIPGGTVLEAEKKDGSWYLVRFHRDDGTTAAGYIHESLVVPLGLPPETAKPEPTSFKPPPVKVEPKTGPDKTAAEKAKPEPIPETSTADLPTPKKHALTLFAGGAYAAVGDLNTGAQGLADFYGALTANQDRSKISGLHLATLMGAELSFGLAPGLDGIVGFEYIAGRRSNRLEFADGSAADAFVTSPKIKAVPVRLGVAYHPFPFFSIKGSLQFIFAKCRYLYRIEQGSFWQEWQGTAKATGLGANVSAGGEWEFYPNLFLVGEAGHNFAKISGFKGKNTTLNSLGDTYVENGTLYFFNSRVSGQEDFPLVFIRDSLPSEPGVSSPREACVNFGGLSLRAGVRVRF